MMDMVKLLHEVDNEDLPCFVAKDLAKLPPIDTTHIDVSTLMVELKSLRREVAQMKDIAVRPEVTDLANELGLLRKEISEVKSCVDGLKKPEKVHVESDVISQVARYELPAVCEPLDFHCPLNKDPHTSSYADVVQSRAPAVKAKRPSQSDRLPTKASENLSVNREGEFTVVSRRSKRRPPPVIAAQNCIPISKADGHGFKAIPGWNEHVREFHSAARDAFKLWASNGKPSKRYQVEEDRREETQFRRRTTMNQHVSYILYFIFFMAISVAKGEKCTEPNSCEQICQIGLSGEDVCSCLEGYIPVGNGTQCQDMDECEAENDTTVCHHHCYNTPGSFYCACFDGYRLQSDGATCRPVCFVNEYPCSDGLCIPNRWICDYWWDCEDDEGEALCGVCGKQQFTCEDLSCIPNDWVCDTDHDCPTGEDEGLCEVFICAEDSYQCDDGKCIRESWKCDGDKDCVMVMTRMVAKYSFVLKIHTSATMASVYASLGNVTATRIVLMVMTRMVAKYSYVLNITTAATTASVYASLGNVTARRIVLMVMTRMVAKIFVLQINTHATVEPAFQMMGAVIEHKTVSLGRMKLIAQVKTTI
ncbi:uncharacterized protein [Ptychodera flava]|uniref:uncharacterized protein n=1 Tax=Ptychodera flava TaxID=63121 RepID=UPI00396A1E74